MFKIIAETAFSHEGNFSYLLQQIDAAAEGKADYIKFQVFINKDEYIVPNHPAYPVLDKWMFTKEQWIKAFDYAKKHNLKILALPLNTSSLDLCLAYNGNIDLLEVHSVCFKDIHLINQLKTTNQKIILGVGGRTEQEVKLLLDQLDKPKSKLILMYGFQSFPTEKSKLNLRKILQFNKTHSIAMGYADHSTFENLDFIDLNTIALSLGANFFEKHIVVEKGIKRIDFESAISAKEFWLMREKLEEAQKILGLGDTTILNDKEELYRSREKQMVFAKNLKKGDKISLSNIIFKITESVSNLTELPLNRELKDDVIANQSVLNKDFYEN